MRLKNPTFNDLELLSRKQIELAIYIRQFRRINEMSQTEMADLCTMYGKKRNVHFNYSEISRYENYKAIPTMPKFQVLLNTMHITPHDLQ